MNPNHSDPNAPEPGPGQASKEFWLTNFQIQEALRKQHWLDHGPPELTTANLVTSLIEMGCDDKERVVFLKDAIKYMREAKNKILKKGYARVYMRKRRSLFWKIEREAWAEERKIYPDPKHTTMPNMFPGHTRTPAHTRLPRLRDHMVVENQEHPCITKGVLCLSFRPGRTSRGRRTIAWDNITQAIGCNDCYSITSHSSSQ